MIMPTDEEFLAEQMDDMDNSFAKGFYYEICAEDAGRLSRIVREMRASHDCG